MSERLKEAAGYALWITISALTGVFLMSLSVKAVGYAFGGSPESPARMEASALGALEGAPNFNAGKIGGLAKQKAKERRPSKNKNTTLLFVGDIMLDRGVKRSVMQNYGGDFSLLFKKIKPAVLKADIAFGNLEGSVSDKGADTGKIYSFRMPPEALGAIKAAGFDALSIANNHTGDWGRVAFEDTLLRLKTSGIVPVGGGYNKNDASGTKIIARNGLRFSFLGFSGVGPNWLKATESKSGILIADGNFANTIKEAAEKTDVLIVSIHFGTEYQNHSNERQRALARAAIDNGALIVVGHHPHVAQEIERYKGGIIAYSLGNFIFDQSFSKETMKGLMLEVDISSAGKIKSFKKLVTELNEFFQPRFK